MNLQTLAALALLLSVLADSAHAARGGQLKIIVLDHDTRQPLAARMHILNTRGRPVRLRDQELYVHGDHIVIDGEATLRFAAGHYTFAIDAGPEYKPYTGHFQIDNDGDGEEVIEMHRFVDLVKEGWWAGDLLAVRLHRHADRLMRAEDLRILPLAVPTSNLSPPPPGRGRGPGGGGEEPRKDPTNPRFAAVQSVYVEDARGALVIHNVSPDDGRLPTASFTDTAAALAYAGEHDCHVDVAFAASWDLPLWLAEGNVDSIQLIDSTALVGPLAQSTIQLPAGCRRPDPSFFPGPTGTGRWAERIYYHVLNCGLRIPPTAGSGSGLTPNPPGASRTYVHCDESAPLDYATWWTNLRAGRVFVTNGPLLRANVNGHPPGHVAHLSPGETIELQIALDLATRDKIEYLEIIKNGDVESQVRLQKWADSGGRLPPVSFSDAGWLTVRAATTNPQVYQHATTGPFYVESGTAPRIGRASVQFFLEWLNELEQLDRRQGRLNADRQTQLAQARGFWNDLAERSGAP